MRLIDADALSEKVCETTIFIKDGEVFQRMINDAPSADRPTMDKEYLIDLIQEAVYDGEACAKLIDLVDRPTGWIPVSERLPNVGEDVLFCVADMYVSEGCRRDDGDWWQFRWSSVQPRSVVTAWMPLPDVYREDGEACTE